LAAYQNIIGQNVRLAGQIHLSSKTIEIPITLKATATPYGPWRGNIRADIKCVSDVARILQPKQNWPEYVSPISMTATLQQSDILSADIALNMRAGKMIWQKYYDKPFKVKRLMLQAKWQENKNLFILPTFSLLLDKATLQGSITFNLNKIQKSYATARFDKISPSQLISLWPTNLASGGRQWIAANIIAGDIQDGRIDLKADNKLNFTFKMHNLIATYRTPMPALEKASGKGVLTEKGLTLLLSEGRINTLNVAPARIEIENWATPINMMRINMPITGELPKLLTVLDSKPLQFISRYGVVPTSTTGTISGQLFLRFPLIADLRTDEIEIQAKASSRSVMVPDIYAGRALNQADLNFDINSTAMVATGKALIGPQPVDLNWAEDFTGTKAAPSHYIINAASSIDTLVLLDIDLTNLADGRIQAEIDLQMKGTKMLNGKFHVDASNTSFNIPFFGQIKPPSIAAQVTGTMHQQGQQLIIDHLSVVSAPVFLQAAAQLPIAQGRSYFDIQKFTFERNHLSGNINFNDNGPVNIEIDNGSWDAKPFLQGSNRADLKQAIVENAHEETIEIKANLDVVEMLNGVNLKHLHGQATIINGDISQLSATGKMSEADITQVKLSSRSVSRTLRVKSQDAGQMGRAFDMFKTGQGGTLELVADIQNNQPTLTMSGRATVKNMRVSDTPLMVRLLTMSSFTGLRDFATKRGILFESIDVPFALQQGIMNVQGMRAIGPGFGFTMEGQAQQASGALNLRGVIIPLYTLNAAVGKIPLLGTLLTDGKDQGLFSLNYSITGVAAKPLIDVQVSSGLALGPLRRLFQGRKTIPDSTMPNAKANVP
jgi:AsmA-like C-terminal region/Protein of unknown function